jgi:hypothetical protein
MNSENEIVQGALISVRLFFIAMTDVCKRMEELTKMITSHKLSRVVETRLKKAADEVITWINENGFRISAEKTKLMFIHRRN